MGPLGTPGRTARSNRTSAPRFDRVALVWTAISVALLWLTKSAYELARPAYPPGSLPDDARGDGSGSCRMSYMSPSYLHLATFDKERTRLGNGPWGLYLYREAGWDQDPGRTDDQGNESLELTGTPVVFVPGNAGSFRQVRSLASAATRTFFELPGVERARRVGATSEGSDGEGAASLDFFTIDFNDDFSAFHGQTLFDQAEYTADVVKYVLGLYQNRTGGGRQTGPPPESVIVVAHSMGGIVARAALLDPRYQPHSISTLITLATPHLVPPVTVDAGVGRVYSSVNSFWRHGYDLSTEALAPSEQARNLSRLARDELEDLVLVSIGGGVSDEMIASEATSLSTLVPPDDSNGFAVSTTAIPGVETPIDHLAILWCQQLMQTLAEAILSIVDVRNSVGVVSRRARVDMLSERLLGAVERTSPRRSGEPELFTRRELGSDSSTTTLRIGERLVIGPTDSPDKHSTFILPVPSAASYAGPRQFSLLSSASIGAEPEDAVQVYGCTSSPSRLENDLANASCRTLFPRHVTVLPGSPHGPVSPVLPASVGADSMSLVTLDAADLVEYEHVVVNVKKREGQWHVAEFADREAGIHVVERGALHLLLFGYKIDSFPFAASALSSEIWLPALDTSLLVLRMKVQRSKCQDGSSLFAPLVRQYSPTLHESKYYPNARIATLYTNAAGPYLPLAASGSSRLGSRLQFFLDPTCPDDGNAMEPRDVSMTIQVDVWRTIGSLVVRYRMAMVTIPFALVMLTFGVQITEFNSGAPFPSFGSAFSTLARSTLPAILAILLGLSYVQAILLHNYASANEALAGVEPGHHLHSHLSVPPSWLNHALLGNSGSFWAPVAPFLTVTMTGVVAIEYIVLSAAVNVAAIVVEKAGGLARKLSQPPQLDGGFQPYAFERLQAFTVLLFSVLVFAPYQFAFLVLFLSHLFTTVHRLVIARSGDNAIKQEDAPESKAPAAIARSQTTLWDHYHMAFSTLFVLLTLLPITAAILVVWVRNLAVGWFAPFSSDRNPLDVLGFLFLVEALHSGHPIKRCETTSLPARALALTGFVAASCSLVYGIASAHRLYTIAHVWAGLVACTTSSSIVNLFTRSPPDVERASYAEGGQVQPRQSARKLATTVER
ncbi:hypothetical protein JCM10212_000698 [Sporobolomyces blumeae]